MNDFWICMGKTFVVILLAGGTYFLLYKLQSLRPMEDWVGTYQVWIVLLVTTISVLSLRMLEQK